MFDTESLRPIIIAMTLYIVSINFLPELLKKPTGVKLIDDMIMLSISQKGMMASGAALVGLIVYLTNYINLEMF